MSARFTTSLKSFGIDHSPLSIETFFTIIDSTVVFNADLVDTITLLPTTMNTDVVDVQINNRDGTTYVKHFRVTENHVYEDDTLYQQTTTESHAG